MRVILILAGLMLAAHIPSARAHSRVHDVAVHVSHHHAYSHHANQPGHHRDARRGGHGFICGLTQRLYFGMADAKFNLAMNWAVYLPHTSAHVGAVVVQRRAGRALGGGPGGHVSRIDAVKGTCVATVTDEKGTYDRDICRNLIAYVEPSGAGYAAHSDRMRDRHHAIGDGYTAANDYWQDRHY